MLRNATLIASTFASLLITAWGGGSPARGASDLTEFDDSPYYGYTTHPPTAVAAGLVPDGADATYVAPEVVGPGDRVFAPSFDAGTLAGPPVVPRTFATPRDITVPEEWQIVPGDLLFRSFLAGVHAPRMGGEIVFDDDQGALLDVVIGSRLSVLRHGTRGPNPEGWELQVYGGAFARLSMDRESDVEATDFTFGVPVVWRRGPTAVSFGYDHISSHLGDEYMIRYPEFERINYVRDALELSVMQDLTESVAVYASINNAFHTSGGAERWHFQFGAEYQPIVPPGFGGAPVAAINTLLREEFDYEGSLGLIAGWQWRGVSTNDLLRLGLSVYLGRSRQFSFFDRYEKLFGVGLWYDF